MNSLFYNFNVDKEFEKRSREGIVSSQNLSSYEIIEAVMRKGIQEEKIWWFAYELMGFHTIDGQRYFLSYKATTRISEMVSDQKIESRKTVGKLNLYRLIC
jgi:hypothetical protein